MRREPAGHNDAVALSVAALALVGLAATAGYSYLLFHSLAETFSVVVAFGIFMVVWNARHLVDDGYMRFIGFAFPFIGIVDLVHMLSFKELAGVVFPGFGADLTVQLWVGARALQAVTFLLAPLMVRRRVRPMAVLPFYFAATVALLLTVFVWRVFPVCFVPDAGMTAFKKIAEYAISGVLLLGLALLLHRRREFDARVLRFLAVAIAATVASEFVFTLYVGLSDPANMLGHLLKLVAFYMMYKACVESALVRPYNVLFRELTLSEDALRANAVRFHKLIEESPDGIVVVNRENLIRYVNPAAEILLGAPEQDLIDEPFGHEVEPGTTAEHEMPRQGGSPVTVRMRVVETIWGGEPCYLATLHDVSDAQWAADARTPPDADWLR